MSKLFEAFMQSGSPAAEHLREYAADPSPGARPAHDASQARTLGMFLAQAPAQSGPPEVEEADAAPRPARRLAYGPRTVHLRHELRAVLLPFLNAVNTTAAEQYRIARTTIVQSPGAQKIILVSSAGPSEGKTTTAINLAGSLALRRETRVLLVDADLRRPMIHHLLGLPEAPGLVDLLHGACRLEDAVMQVVEVSGLYFMPAGASSVNPAELLDRWTDVCRSFRKVFDHVVVDSTAVGAVADYDLIQSGCDGVVLVVRPDHTRRKACFQAIHAVPPSKLMGALLNGVSGSMYWNARGGPV